MNLSDELIEYLDDQSPQCVRARRNISHGVPPSLDVKAVEPLPSPPVK